MAHPAMDGNGEHHRSDGGDRDHGDHSDRGYRRPASESPVFGGGLALSNQFTANGLSDWIGEQMADLGFLPIILLVGVVAAVVLVLTEFTSNTATAATFLPLVGAMAIGLGVDQMLLAVPVALAATSAFMMPVATPPNAIAYGSGYVTMGNMVRTGVWLNIIALIVISAASMTLLGWVFGVVY